MFSTFSYHSQEKEGDHVSHNRSGTQHSNDFLTFTRLLDCSRYLQQGTVASLDLHRPWYQSHGQQISSRGNQLSNLNLAYTNSLASFSKPSTTPSGGLYRSGTFHALDITSPTQALDIPLANFGYNIPAAYCNLDIPSLNTRPIPHTSIYRSRSEQFERHSDKDYNLTSDMALTSGKKLCKLDAICAKLKKISNTRNPENETIANGADKSTDEVATDLSAKCLNNNVIGKLDLHTVDDTNESQDGLDLTKNKEDNEADVMVFKNSEISESEQALTKQDANDKDLNKESNIEHDKETSEFCTPAPKVTDAVKTAGSSRRKSRKASAPRSISQVRDFYEPVDDKDELAEYEINNLNTNFPPDETEEGESDLSSSKKHSLSTSHECDEDSNSSLLHSDKSLNNSNNSRKSLNSLNSSEYASPSGVLDLSVNNKSCSKQDQVHNGYNSSDADEEDDDYFHRKRKLVIDEQKGLPRSSSSSLNLSHGSNKDSNGEQAAHLKDFAENTMNELISMYGYGGAGYPGTDLSKHIPMKNFSDIIQQAQAAQLASLAAIHPGLTAAATHPISIGDEESRDRSQPMKNIYANMAKSGQPVPSKVEGVPKLPKNDRFTSSSSFINAMYSSPGNTSQPGKTLLPNYSKYLKRYNTGMECGGQHCKDLSYKEHYHCIDCSFQVFVKKEEMVRHYKWHRKREESLQHGFLRFSPLDDCTKRFGPCTHNGKQTHYHCLQNGCDKVYISTSDVQMHANYHRKDSAIMSEGFQRFRATEDCGTLSCAFYGQRTTHFHCLRSDCKFTFKNKADMEKHKSYHQKDEVLGRDGFKKFMKYEHCNYSGCRYSKVSNHIHCIRSGCDYVLHSTAQLYSHKRKHERRDFESAYKRFRDNHPPGSSQSQKHGQVPILPRPDMSRLQFQPINGSKTGLPTLGSLSGLKRASDIELSEPFELKKPKLEPMSDIDMSAPSSPGGQSDDHSSTMDRARSDFDQMDTEASNMSECSSDMLQDENRSFDKINTDQDGVDLNSSLNLPIHPLQVKSEFKMEAGGLSTSSSPTLQPSIMPGTLTGNLITLNPGTLMTVPSTLTGASTVLQPPKSVYAERREKDDSWKTYLVRYTANDPCNPRCQYLYKDHYHCKVDGCLVLFKSKDGVREHARFHELQDRITPIAYRAYEVSDTCPEACQYSEKEKHFHCIWTGCTHVVPYVGPTFGRLEHYRIHEYARAAAGKSYSKTSKNSMDENSMRRRGRPPKYPKLELPKIPKVELTDEEIRQSHVPDSEVTSKLKVINGFRIFTPDDPCPDEQCNFVGKVHFHCARPRCFTITDRQDVLNLHAQDFHSFVKILEGFEFFDRNVSCRRLHCPNNQNNRHFHCTRPKCDYSFIRHSTMAQHEKKHLYSETGGYPSGAFSMKNDVPVSPTAFRRDVPIKNLSDTAVSMESNLGQASPNLGGEKTYIPVSNMKQLPHIPLLLSSSSQLAAVPQGSIIFPQQGNFTLPQASLATTSLSGSQVSLALTVSSVQALPASVTSQQVLAGFSPQLVSTVASGAANSPTEPLTVLLQRGVNPIPQPSWNELKAKMHYTVSQNCGRPFCKLKKKDHFHCYDCNQAFSDPARLRSHMGKHGIKLKRTDPVEQTEKASPPTLPTALETKLAVEGIETDMDPDEAKCLEEGKEFAEDSEAEDELKSSSSLNLNPSTFSEMITKAQEQNKISPEMDEDEEEDCNRDQDEDDLDGNQSDASEPKLDLSSRSGRKITKTKHEDFMNSGEINLSKQQRKPKVNTSSQSSNGLSPKGQTLPLALPSRNLKDDLVPDGYSKWKYNEECNYPKCAYRHSVTHFHCNREDCGYGFSDRSRLVQHTLRHERIDSITGGELQQYRINQDCENAECEFNKKMSHFHCKRCIYSCTDSSKVLTHRKYHAKLDNIANQGFQKYSTIEDCGNTLCPYARKQTHFHCLKDACNIAVLGPAQMTSHKAKHM